MEQPNKEICMIKIALVVETDAEAMAIKAKIKEALGDKPDVQIDFRLMSGRPAMPTA